MNTEIKEDNETSRQQVPLKPFVMCDFANGRFNVKQDADGTITIYGDNYVWEPVQPGTILWELCLEAIEAKKLRTMCKAAAAEILEQWEHHTDKDGYGPANLISRLQGDFKPDFYHAYDT